MFKPIAIAVFFILFGLLETHQPFFQYSSSGLKQLGLNLIVGITNLCILSLLIFILFKLGCSLNPSWSFHGLINQPIAIASLILFIILDLYHYLWHYLMHSTSWGWRIHRFHHSDTTMNVSTAYRFSTLEILASYAPKLLLLATIGIQPTQLIFYESCFAISLIFHHSNWNLATPIDRALSHLLVTPNLHRLHHSTDIQTQPCNFSSLLTLWDHLGHTFQYPRTPHRLTLGLRRLKSPDRP